MAATKPAIMMLMIGSLSCGVLAIFLSLFIGITLFIAIPGLVIGTFFAFRYAMYNRSKGLKGDQQEQRRDKRKTRNR